MKNYMSSHFWGRFAIGLVLFVSYGCGSGMLGVDAARKNVKQPNGPNPNCVEVCSQNFIETESGGDNTAELCGKVQPELGSVSKCDDVLDGVQRLKPSKQRKFKSTLGHDFSFGIGPAKSPADIQGDEKPLRIEIGGKVGDSFYPMVLETKDAVEIYAPFIYEESIPPWNTAATPIFVRFEGEEIQVGRYLVWEGNGWSPTYYSPVFCEEEFSEVCSLNVSVTHKPDQPNSLKELLEYYQANLVLEVAFSSGNKRFVFNYDGQRISPDED